jgi:hypothetical protein
MTIILDGTPQAPPWTAEHYQVQKYGSRYYVDDKPPCALISDPHNEPVPGFSSLKPSKPFRKSVTIGDRKYTVPLDWYNAGDWFDKSDGDLSGADWWHAYYRSAKDAQNRNFARGHAIHRVAEAFLLGKPTNTETNADAQPYLPHLIAWLDANITDIHALEAVVFGYGYGGTGDLWGGVRGVSTYVDFKSRGADSAHDIYPEEIAQGGAYTSARYCILPSDDRQTAVRAPLPPATYGLVLSIRPDGIEEFWYDLEGAKESFKRMHDAHRYTSDSGKLARAAKIKDPTSVQESAKRKTKAKAQPTVTAPTRPDEGASPVDVEPIRKAYDALPEAGRKWIGQRAIEARQALVPFNVSELRSERRAGIMGGLVALAANDAADDESLRAIVRFVTTDDSAEWPTIPAGASLGTLGAEEATLFAATCRAYVGGMLAFDFASGRPTLVEVK